MRKEVATNSKGWDQVVRAPGKTLVKAQMGPEEEHRVLSLGGLSTNVSMTRLRHTKGIEGAMCKI